jgi:hypothetical protein
VRVRSTETQRLRKTVGASLEKADEGPERPEWSDDPIAEALELSSGGVANIRRRHAERGLEGCVRRKAPDREYKTKPDGEQEARLIRPACSKAREGHGRWSLRLLADRLVELNVVGSIGHETVRQTLQTDRSKTDSSPTGIASR